MAGLITDFSTTFNTQYMLNNVTILSQYFNIFLYFLLFKFNSFFENNPDRSLLQTQINTASSRIQRNVLWYNKNFNSIRTWLKLNRPTSTLSKKEYN